MGNHPYRQRSHSANSSSSFNNFVNRLEIRYIARNRLRKGSSPPLALEMYSQRLHNNTLSCPIQYLALHSSTLSRATLCSTQRSCHSHQWCECCYPAKQRQYFQFNQFRSEGMGSYCRKVDRSILKLLREGDKRVLTSYMGAR